ncbi:MAG: GNAT family N-acetyltransferase [Pseudomonadota bacterium]
MDIAIGSTADAARVAEFGRRSFVEAFGEQNSPQHLQEYVDSAFSVETLRQEILDPDAHFFLAHGDDGELLGYAKLCANRPIDCVADPSPFQIERIYVDQHTQSRGVGGRLLTHAMRVAESNGGRTIWLSVWNINASARRFYERHGFDVVGETYFMLGPERQDDVVMARSIAGLATA